MQRHVAMTSTLPVFEMGSLPGRPTFSREFWNRCRADAREGAENKLKYGDAARLKKSYGTEISPMAERL